MSWLQDVRHAARSLRKSTGFTLVAAITLDARARSASASPSARRAIRVDPVVALKID